ncbi:MAG: 50S ribosomal protein L9 [Halanaerobiales bacterium]
MKVILREDVDNLGSEGDIVEVADGYARNYLLPRRLAEEATKGKIKQVRQRKEKREEKKQKQREKAQKKADELTGKTFEVSVKAGEEGRLFGSITTNDIADKLAKAGYDEIEKVDIELDENIKDLGVHKVPVKIFADIRAEIKIKVVEA